MAPKAGTKAAAAAAKIPDPGSPSVRGGRVRKVKDPNKPKAALSAYILWANDNRAKIKAANKEAPPTDIMRLLGEAWRAVPANKKAPYEKKAAAEKERFKEEMQGYVAPPDMEDNGRAGKAKKDPNMPKKGLSSYFIFCNDKRAQIREANPDMPVTQISKELGAMWKEISDKDKAKYEALAAKDKQRANKAIEAYNKERATESATSSGSSGIVEDDGSSAEEEEEEKPTKQSKAATKKAAAAAKKVEAAEVKEKAGPKSKKAAPAKSAPAKAAPAATKPGPASKKAAPTKPAPKGRGKKQPEPEPEPEEEEEDEVEDEEEELQEVEEDDEEGQSGDEGQSAEDEEEEEEEEDE